MSLQIVGFGLWGVLWAVYFALDGFDFGAGMIYGFLGRNEAEKAAVRRSIGPVWDGNEVWIIAAGGVTFAVFPGAYASLFSFLYPAFLLILFGLIFRGTALEFRAKFGGAAWAKVWDFVFGAASFLPAFLFGVVFGNLFRGLPIDASGYHGSLLGLFNPYGVLTGALFAAMFAVHGALWVALKTAGELGARARRLARELWSYLLILAAGFLVASYFSTGLPANYLKSPLWAAVPAAAVAALSAARLFIGRKRAFAAFLASGATILLVTATGLVGLFPNLIPSRMDPAFSLTIFNSSSSPYTLKVMTVVALIFVPIVIAYQIWVYRLFRSKIDATEKSEEYY
jgi:cytochrome bd ubiquinol oxidase subunit II